MLHYSLNIAWSEEDGAFVATSPELPGLSAFGDTPEEAAAEAQIAAQGFLEVMEADGDAIPEPLKVEIAA